MNLEPMTIFYVGGTILALVPGLAGLLTWFMYRLLKRALGLMEALQSELLAGLVATRSTDPATVHHFLQRDRARRQAVPSSRPEETEGEAEKAGRTGIEITHGG